MTTDHGIPFPGAKATLYDRGLGVMLIVRGPGGFSGGHVTDALVSHLDVCPTLCELAGVERPDFLQGTSLMPLVRGEAEEVNDTIFAEATGTPPTSPSGRCVRSAGSTSAASAIASVPCCPTPTTGRARTSCCAMVG